MKKRLLCAFAVAALLPALNAKSLWDHVKEFFGGKPTPTIDAQVPEGVMGGSYRATLTAKGGTAPYTWQITGPLWATGLLSSSNTVMTISGTPDRCATSPQATITGSVTDRGGKSAVVSYSFRVLGDPAKPLKVATLIRDGKLGAPYSWQMAATGGCQ